jgi:copper chaperone CopZ
MAAKERSTAILDVRPMLRGSEKAVVEAVLGRRPGVERVEANPVSQTATVVYDPTQTDVDPAEPSELGPPHPGGDDEQPEGVQVIMASVRQEGPQLLGGPDLHLGRGAPRRGDRISYVTDQVAEAHGIS